MKTYAGPDSRLQSLTVDSRTVLDVMGAKHLLGKGGMLCLPQEMGKAAEPPASST
jgi:DNA segregation ATPase FtsK/SpoIIIE-like protein